MKSRLIPLLVMLVIALPFQSAYGQSAAQRAAMRQQQAAAAQRAAQQAAAAQRAAAQARADLSP